MKIKHFLYSLLVIVVFSTSCKDGFNSTGIQIQPQGDRISIVTDTFYLATKDSIIESISAQCIDSISMLLGEYYSAKYGSTKADLLIQVAPTIGYKFPPAEYNPQPDSLVLYLFYKSYFGVGNEPIEISFYELNKATPDYYYQYLTDFDVTEFVDISNGQLLGKKIVTSVDQTLSEVTLNSKSYIQYVKYSFSNEQMQRFFNIPESAYLSIDDFLKEFKGLYITTSYGKSTMLYLMDVDMRLFYHYSYNESKQDGTDTLISVDTYVDYPASKDVRQLNSIKHKDIKDKINKRDSVNYITTAGGMYPKIKLPLSKIRSRISDSLPDKNLRTEVFINSALLSVEAVEIDSSKNAMPIPQVLYVLPIDEIDDFIKTGSVKSYRQNKSQMAFYNSQTNEYSVDLAPLLNKVIKSDDNRESVEYLLVPIDVYNNDDGVAMQFRFAKKIGGVTVRSGKNQVSPMRLELIYSGF